MKVLLIVAGTFAATVGTYVIVDTLTPAAPGSEGKTHSVVAPAPAPAAPPAPVAVVKAPAAVSLSASRTTDDKFSSVAPVAGPTPTKSPATSPFLAKKAFEDELKSFEAPLSAAPTIAVRAPTSVSTNLPPIAEPPPAPRPVVEPLPKNIVTVPSAFNPVALASTGSKCDFLGKNLPKDTIVVAAGSYSGRLVPFQIDQSGHQATQFDIGVHADKPVALLLSAYAPTIWSLGWTQNTRIVAVFATGYHRQAVAGLPPGVPLIVTDHAAKDGCVHQYLSRSNLAWVNPASRTIFGKEATRVYPDHKNGLIEITESTRAKLLYVSSPVKTPEMFRDVSAPPAGKAGIEEAIRKGILRKATAADFEQVKVAYVKLATKRSSTNRPDVPPVAGSPANALPSVPMPQYMSHNAYVVLKPFVFPAGLHGADSVTVIVPKGVAAPTGNPGHSQVFDLNKEQPCSGILCR